jgi:hypothetical protein
MSHTTAIKTVAITDIQALKQAVAKMKASGVNCELVEKQKPRMYYSNQHGVCDYVLKLPNCKYDVGFDKQEDGSYAPVFDEWAGEVKGQIGCNCPTENSADKAATHIGALMQGYAVEAATNSAINQGYYVESAETDADGNVQLVLGGM